MCVSHNMVEKFQTKQFFECMFVAQRDVFVSLVSELSSEKEHHMRHTIHNVVENFHCLLSSDLPSPSSDVPCVIRHPTKALRQQSQKWTMLTRFVDAYGPKLVEFSEGIDTD